MTHRSTPILAVLLTRATLGHAAGDPATEKLNDFLVDITGGTVSAGGLVGLDKGITQVETSQDLIVALQPLTSGDDKAPFGLAITPARTSLMPMAGTTYRANAFARFAA